jgi:nucleotide-binding universal stress UspA family protein
MIGLSARAAAKWLEKRRVIAPELLALNVLSLDEAKDLMPLYKGSTLVAIKTASLPLVEEASLHAKGKGEQVVYTLYVEEKPPGWAFPNEIEPSLKAVQILNRAVIEFEKKGITAVPLWNFGDDPAAIIVKTSGELNLNTVMIGATKRGTLERILKGEVLQSISHQLPPDKNLVICN